VISAAAAWLLAVAGVQAQGLALPDPTRWQTTLAPRSAAVQGVQYAAAAQEGEGLVYPKMPTILKTAGQMARPGGKTAEDDIDFAIRTELPDPGELFKRDSERQLFERIRQEARKRPGSGRINFPRSRSSARARISSAASSRSSSRLSRTTSAIASSTSSSRTSNAIPGAWGRSSQPSICWSSITTW
jgi:hypothetical protein